MFNYSHLPGFESIDHTIADQLLWLSMEFPLIKTHRTDQVGTASVMARWTPYRALGLNVRDDVVIPILDI
jgi:hypothetical protein